MLLVSDFPTRPGLYFEGTFLLTHRRELARLPNGRVFGIGVEDTSGATEARVHVRGASGGGNARGPGRKQLRHLRLRTVARSGTGACHGPVDTVIVDFSRPAAGKLVPTPTAATVQAAAVHRLDRILDEALTHAPLRAFLRDVFSDRALRAAFLRAGASRDYHHSDTGGLLAHSIDVVDRLAAITRDERDPLQRQCALLVGLLHDVGKLASVLTGHRCFWSREHAQLNAPLLERPLYRLRQQDEEAWITLHYLFSVVAGNVPAGRMAVATLLRTIDQYSAARDGQQRAFAQHAGAGRIAAISPTTGGPRRVFIRSSGCMGRTAQRLPAGTP